MKTQNKARTQTSIKRRLEYLRREIKLERISQGEIIELESLQKFIAKDDIELLQWARPEFNETCKELNKSL